MTQSTSPGHSSVCQSRLLKTMSSWILNMFKGGCSTDTLGNLFQLLPPLTVKKLFFCLNRILSISIHVCPILFCHQTLLALSSLPPPIRYLYTLIRSPEPSLFHAEQSHLYQLHLVCQTFQSWPVMGLSLPCPHFSCTGEPRAGHRTPDVSQQSRVKGKDHLS